MNKIKIEVKVVLNELITSYDDTIHKFIVKNQESNLNENEDLITILKKDIEFLRKELQSKDLIINMMIKENALKEGCVKSIQDSAKSSESNLTVKVTEKI